MNYSEVPQLQRFHIPEVKHVLPTEASTQIEAGLVLPVDVREASEIDSTSIDCYQLLIHPMSGILDTMNDLPREKPLIIICEHGERSVKVANLLRIQGFTEVYNLDGGVHAWRLAGLPLVGGNEQHSCGSCSCGCH
ncbi:MAG: rhodanese-like domain-containing protein [Bacteroidetes bacterium HGW-Bacteroidetes-6]|jgi:rhodanese-related sulfurtransferase|nr:MAG: rhodanese-like domain-containing protein [Bacteroidetes bacterium HGW-Bacteroidetes-6]